MQRRIRREKGTFVQIQGFMDRNRQWLVTANASDARQALDEAVEGLTVAESGQNAFRQTSGVSRVAVLVAREKLLTKQMRAVAAAAKFKLDVQPELATIVAPPARIGTADLLVAATKMVQETERFASVLTPALGPDHVNKLRASIEAVTRAQAAGRTSREQHVGATTATKRWAKRARLAVRLLNPLVAEALEDSPELLSEWNACRKKAGVSRGESAVVSAATVAPAGVVLVGAGEEVKSAA